MMKTSPPNMSRPTFIGQPFLHLPTSKPKHASNLAPILSLHPLSLAQSPASYTVSTPTPQPVTFPYITTTPDFSPPPPAAPSKTVILWFRTDLRLHDHPALTHAIDESPSSLLPLFVFDPRNYGKTRFGFEKTGRYRAKFLIDSVNTLRQSLKQRGSDLVVRVGHPEKIIPQLAKHVGASAIFCHTDIRLEDTKLEASLESTLHRIAVEFCPMWSNTLYHIDDLPFSIDQLPDVYTTYREQVQTKSQLRPPLPAPKVLPRLPQIDSGQIPSLAQLGLTEPSPRATSTNTYIGGETEALKRLSKFVKQTVNPTVGSASAEHLGSDFSCRISPWLALGCVSPRQIYADLAEAAPKAKQVAMYFDLVWRDFFRYITVKYSRATLFKAPTSSPAAVAR